MLHVISTFEYGDNRHVIYRADAEGDQLPLHAHEDRGHLTVCMTGIVEAFFPDRASIRAEPGDKPFEFGINRLHGVRAITAGATFMSIQVIQSANVAGVVAD